MHRAEAHVIAATCSAPPARASRCTLRMLSDYIGGLRFVESIGTSMIGRVLKKQTKTRQVEQWCMPAEQNAAFVSAMPTALWGRCSLLSLIRVRTLWMRFKIKSFQHIQLLTTFQ